MLTLEEKIVKAFNCVKEIVNTKDVASLNENLPLMDENLLKQFLPQLLLNEIYIGKECAPDGDLLIYFLDGARLKKIDNATFLPKESECAIWQRQFAEKIFSTFTFYQANAIHSWLVQCAKQKYRKRNAEAIESAIQYWKTKKENLYKSVVK